MKSISLRRKRKWPFFWQQEKPADLKQADLHGQDLRVIRLQFVRGQLGRR
ncbi:MAG: hypothetical protein HZB20_04350 [Chloroflexi bacterium]|nr:hypothetical protein [Chloroflexota bacterium]